MAEFPRGANASLSDIKERYRHRGPSLVPADEYNGVTGLSAELLKYHSERKLLHSMLTDAGIPETTPQGERVCLIGRLGVALGRL